MDYVLDAYDAVIDNVCCCCVTYEEDDGGGGAPETPTRHVTILPGEEDVDGEFGGNAVVTSKFTVLSFLPLALYEQFRKLANLYFLFISVIQLATDLSPTNKFSTIIPLIGVLTVSLIKEALEDVGRHRSDATVNAAQTSVLSPEGTWTRVEWRSVIVGDVVKLHADEAVPADCVLLSAPGLQGATFVDTAQLDGESNLKARAPLAPTQPLGQDERSLSRLRGHVTCEEPNPYLYRFSGLLTMQRTKARGRSASPGGSGGSGSVKAPISNANVLLRGMVLRNTPWAVGLIVYAGHETKVMLNARAPPRKRSAIDHRIDHLVLAIFGFLVVLCSITAVGSVIGGGANLAPWYLPYLKPTSGSSTISSAALVWITALLLFNNLLPISLVVTIELAKFIQARSLDTDPTMVHTALVESDGLGGSLEDGTVRGNTTVTIPARARTSNLNESLGQVEYIVTDKTGTLTQNRMLFRSISVAGTAFSSLSDAAGAPSTQAVGISESGSALSTVESNVTQTSANYTRAEDSGPMYHPDATLGWTDARLRALLSDTSAPGHDIAREAMICMILCHGVQVRVRDVPRMLSAPIRSALAPRSGRRGTARTTRALELDPASLVYQSSSPDEIALVSACRALGFVLEGRDDTINSLTVRIFGEPSRYELLAVNDFSSARKRMSVLVRAPSGAVILYVKGADSHMLNKLADPQPVFTKSVVSPRLASDTQRITSRSVPLPGPVLSSQPDVAVTPPEDMLLDGILAGGDAGGDALAAQQAAAAAAAAASATLRAGEVVVAAAAALEAGGAASAVVADGSDATPAAVEGGGGGEGGGAGEVAVALGGGAAALPTSPLDALVAVAREGGSAVAPAAAMAPSRAASRPASAAAARGVALAAAENSGASSLDTLQAHIDSFASLGLRTLVLARRELSATDAALMLAAHKKASMRITGRDEALEEVADAQEVDMQVLAATGIEDKLQDGVPETISALSSAGVRWVMCTGDKTETAINVGLACSLLSESSSLVVLKSNDRDANIASLAAARMSLQERGLWHPNVVNTSLVLIVEGHALSELMGIDGNDEGALPKRFQLLERAAEGVSRGAAAAGRFLVSLVSWMQPADSEINGATGEILDSARSSKRKTGLRTGLSSQVLTAAGGGASLASGSSGSTRTDLLEFMQQCRSVICCRVSPLQKAEVVKLLQTGIVPRPLVLSVGDGGNDVSMIQAADVGVGIAGVEGQQAVQASDYSIGQFRFLAPLLLVHGRSNLRRIVLTVLYCIYKNVCMVMCLWAYSVAAGWSGTSLFESYVSSMWNLLFTSLPILVAACYDEDIRADWALAYPLVYVAGTSHDRGGLSTSNASKWFLHALMHAAIVCVITFFGFLTMPSAPSRGLIPDGCTVHFVLVLTVNMKLALEVYTWRFPFRAALAFSLSIWFVFLLIYSELYKILRFDAVSDIYGVGVFLITLPAFWLLVPLVPIAALLPDYFLLLIERSVRPDAAMLVQEWSAGHGEPLSLDAFMEASGAAPAIISAEAAKAARAVSIAAKGAAARAARSKGPKGGSHQRNTVTVSEGAARGSGVGDQRGVTGVVIDSDALGAKIAAALAAPDATSAADAAEHKRIVHSLAALTREVNADIERLAMRVQRRALRAVQQRGPGALLLADAAPEAAPAPAPHPLSASRRSLSSPSMRSIPSFRQQQHQAAVISDTRSETPALLLEIGTAALVSPAGGAVIAPDAEEAMLHGFVNLVSSPFRSPRSAAVVPLPAKEVPAVSAPGEVEVRDNVLDLMHYSVEDRRAAKERAAKERAAADLAAAEKHSARRAKAAADDLATAEKNAARQAKLSRRTKETLGRSEGNALVPLRSPAPAASPVRSPTSGTSLRGDHGASYGLDRFGPSARVPSEESVVISEAAAVAAPEVQDTRYSRLTHRFVDSKLEVLFFKNFFIRKSIRLMRLALGLAASLTLLYMLLALRSNLAAKDSNEPGAAQKFLLIVTVRGLIVGGGFAFLVISCFDVFKEPAFYSASMFTAFVMAGLAKTAVIDGGGMFGEALFIMGVMLVLRMRFLHCLAVCAIDLSIYVIFVHYFVNTSTAPESQSNHVEIAVFVVYCLFLLTFCGLSSWTLQCAMREDFIGESKLYKEEKRGGELLSSMLPSYVITMLRSLGPSAGDWGGLVSFAEPSVTVIFVQIAGFDKVVSRWQPADLVALLDELWGLLDALLERHGCTKLETVGKEYVACAGLHGERLDHASSCVALALDVIKAVSLMRGPDGKPPFHLKIGINTGKLVAGIVGRTRPQFSLVGDTMNTTARIAAFGTEDRCNISPATYERVKHRYVTVSVIKEVKSKGTVNIRWVAGRVGTASAISVVAAAGAVADDAPSASPIRGRSDEPAAPADAASPRSSRRKVGGSSRAEGAGGSSAPPTLLPEANVALNEAGIDASDALVKRISERGRLERARTADREQRRSRDVALKWLVWPRVWLASRWPPVVFAWWPFMEFVNPSLERRWCAATAASMIPGVRRCLLIQFFYYLFQLLQVVIVWKTTANSTTIMGSTLRQTIVRLAYMGLLLSFILFTRTAYYIGAVPTTADPSNAGTSKAVTASHAQQQPDDRDADSSEPREPTVASRVRIWVRLNGHAVVLALGGLATVFASVSAQDVTLDFFFFFCVSSNSGTLSVPVATVIDIASAAIFVILGRFTSLFSKSSTETDNTELGSISIFFLITGILMSAFAQIAVEYYRKHRFGIAALTADEVGRNTGLLTKMLPVAIAHQLLEGTGTSRISSYFPGVCILFCDVAGFTKMSAEIRPDEVIAMLNKMFSGFEAAAARNGVFKVQTIGDCFVCVAGMPYVDEPFNLGDESRNALVTMRSVSTRSASESASSEVDGDASVLPQGLVVPGSRAAPQRLSRAASLSRLGDWECMGEEARSYLAPEVLNAAVMLRHAADMLEVVESVLHPHTGKPINVRIGLHTGDVAGGVIGTKSFRYDIFGVDVLAANTMESSSTVGGILASETTYAALEELQTTPYAVPGLEFVRSEPAECKGKAAPLETYFVAVPGCPFPDAARNASGLQRSGH